MGKAFQRVTDNGNGTSTLVWEYNWHGNLFGVNDRNTIDVRGPIVHHTITNNGGETKELAGGQGHTFLMVNSHSGGGFDGGNCVVTVTYRNA